MTEAILLSNATTCVGSAPYLIATHFDAISLIIARIRRNVPDAKSGVSNGHATDAVVVESHENFRSPRSVVKTINFFGLTQETILARSTYSGDQPEIVRYDGEESLITHTAAAITRYLEKGFEPNEIVVLSMRGLKNSVLVRSKIGVHDMTYFTGQFDKSRNPVWSAGDILFDSVYRFKGQSAPAVVVSEIDFEILSDSERKKLFVAMTRAEIELTMIMSERAEGLLMSRVGSCERNTLEVTVEQSFVQARCPPLSD